MLELTLWLLSAKTLETVAGETPAARATSDIRVGGPVFSGIFGVYRGLTHRRPSPYNMANDFH